MKVWQLERQIDFGLLEKKFTFLTDHTPLEGLNRKVRTDEELSDLAQELPQFDFELLYNPGAHNSETDCLSRISVSECIPENESKKMSPPSINFLTLDQIKAKSEINRKVAF
mgnify:CR=1 FL=1